MTNKGSNPLVGLCPICSGATGEDGASSAYVECTIVASDKNVPLVWSKYYDANVCRVCQQEGADKGNDDIRNENSAEKETERQEMGFTETYDPNTLLGD